MGRDRKEAVLIAGLIICTIAQGILTVWMLVDFGFRFLRFTG